MRTFHRSAATLAWLVPAVVACAPDGEAGPEPQCEEVACPPDGSGGDPAGGTGAGGASFGGASQPGGGGAAPSGGTFTGNGGTASGLGGSPGSGGTAMGTGGATPGNGGAAPGSGGAVGTGGSPGAGGQVATYTLVVDAPANGATVDGAVSVRGRAPGFLNVEVWDATHTNPPLAQATPASDGAFSATVDTSAFARGATTWTVHAWDSPPGQSFTNTDSVTLALTIGGPPGDPCASQTCSGHGSCTVAGGAASCTCDGGYHAVGLQCVPDSTGNDGVPDPGNAYVPSGHQLVFGDEFSGTTLDTGKWNTLAPYGVQFYPDSHQKQAFIPEAVSVHDGIVTFTAERSRGNTNGQPYSSGSLTTHRTFTHGYFESRIRVPAGKGFWPAYWLTSSTRWPPEWDIMEIVDGVIFGYTHPVSGGRCVFVEGAAGSDATYTLPNLYGIYHVYGFRWTSSDAYWYVDGVMTEHYSIDAAAGANDPFWLNVSLQVGGDWPGDPDSSTPFPGRMDVDYVRVYQN